MMSVRLFVRVRSFVRVFILPSVHLFFRHFFLETYLSITLGHDGPQGASTPHHTTIPSFRPSLRLTSYISILPSVLPSHVFPGFSGVFTPWPIRPCPLWPKFLWHSKKIGKLDLAPVCVSTIVASKHLPPPFLKSWMRHCQDSVLPSLRLSVLPSFPPFILPVSSFRPSLLAPLRAIVSSSIHPSFLPSLLPPFARLSSSSSVPFFIRHSL